MVDCFKTDPSSPLESTHKASGTGVQSDVDTAQPTQSGFALVSFPKQHNCGGISSDVAFVSELLKDGWGQVVPLLSLSTTQS